MAAVSLRGIIKVNLSLSLLAKALILIIIFMQILQEGNRDFGDLGDFEKFALTVIVIALWSLSVSVFANLFMLPAVRKLEEKAARQEKKKIDQSEEKKIYNNLQEKTTDGRDKVDADLHPAIQLSVAEHKAILNEMKTKCEEDIKIAIDKCKKELKEKCREKKIKYRAEKANWEEQKCGFWWEIGKLQQKQDRVLWANPWYQQYGTNQQYGANQQDGTNQQDGRGGTMGNMCPCAYCQAYY